MKSVTFTVLSISSEICIQNSYIKRDLRNRIKKHRILLFVQTLRKFIYIYNKYIHENVICNTYTIKLFIWNINISIIQNRS